MHSVPLEDIPSELIERYTGSGVYAAPRPRGKVRLNGLGPEDYADALQSVAARAQDSLALYVHLPFCPVRCLYCACNTNITHDSTKIEDYLDTLEREMDLVVGFLGRGRRVLQLHVGGGTPNYLTDGQLARLMDMIEARFELAQEGTACIECNPRLASAGQLDLLRGLGFGHISFGVQDLSPTVQRAIGRLNSVEVVRDVYATAREAGFSNVNIDLVCGLPDQTEEGFDRTVQQVIEMEPDRVRCYSYAHSPSRQPHQFAIDQHSLPSPAEKLALFHRAVTDFTQAGYLWIGADCFARPTDEWSLAQAERRLRRNSVGYTAVPTNHLIALGTNGLGDVDSALLQNEPLLEAWRRAVANGRLPIAWGHRLTDDDLRRRRAFEHLMCNLELPAAMAAGLEEDYKSLSRCVDDGLVEVAADSIRITPRGRYFLRDLCAKHAASLDWDSAPWHFPKSR
jgi:oxygen-independent coproporphyrinogen III oxidase